MNPEKRRLVEARQGTANWNRWGPYLSERQWGTVREDYSATGDAWEYLSHDDARSRAYRWGEDGLAGMCDLHCRLCLSLALWNGQDTMLKERLFGLTNAEGNHGEDVKELYYYLDATPTHSYLKMLYKYPQQEFPYSELRAENAARDRTEPEFELLDTGIFDDNRYFDVFVEYAKGSPDDLLMRITVYNRGPDPATIHLLPQLWFRNTWSWNGEGQLKGELAAAAADAAGKSILASHPRLGHYQFHAAGPCELLFCDNETNARKLFGQPGKSRYSKDGFHEYLVGGIKGAVNPQRRGTKAAAWYRPSIAPGERGQLRLRLTPDLTTDPMQDFDDLFSRRQAEADEFYRELQSEMPDADDRLVQRQAFAGLIWSKQYYYYDVTQWLDGDSSQPPPPQPRRQGRNRDWKHLNNADIISMPDKWEYPWYAAWDLAFHCLPLAAVDAEFAKAQLVLLTREWYMHANGQLPAYEWALSDANPPVHAWATWRVFQIDRKQRGDHGDIEFLERVFHKLMLNFTWWVNRKDTQGRNIFQGGFLGLDNIGVFDRNTPLAGGGYINQADGTSWMAMYCLNLLRIALELALFNRVYEDIASKFFEHFLYIAEAMTNIGQLDVGLWDDEDGFYYDKLIMPDGRVTTLKARSMVGLIPLFAVETLEPELLERLPGFHARLKWFLKHRPALANLVSRWVEPGRGERRLLSLLRGSRMKKLLRRMLDESEFLSPYGVRSVSRSHRSHPYQLPWDGQVLEVDYQPGEATTFLFGGNSNWRGPVWFPVNYLIIESLQKFHHYYGDDFQVECPTGSGQYLSINGIARELTQRLTRLFRRNDREMRPIFGDCDKLQRDPHFRDYLLFHEYFHGDNGVGLGAAHQTGWTGLIAKLLMTRHEECVGGGPASVNRLLRLDAHRAKPRSTSGERPT